MTTDEGTKLFDAVVRAVEHDPSIGTARGFGASGLKVGGKIFAMLMAGELVVKLPAARARQLVGDGAASVFHSGAGRPMREWVVVPATDADHWIAVAEEARAYVDPARPA
jgi:hypothetical protein